MKILAIPSCLDLKLIYGIIPAWWQILKGLYEEGVEVIAIPYRGRAVETLWWRTYENPCKNEGDLFVKFKDLTDKFKKTKQFKKDAQSEELQLGEKAMLKMVHNLILPRWKKQVERVLRKEKNVDAVIIFGVPLNHLVSLPTFIQKKFGIPVFFYDGDVPASLPSFGGFKTGFRIYQGADLKEYDGFICNSKGGKEELTKMGAKNVQHVYWGVDPEVFAPMKAPKKDLDFFFYGVADEYREEWVRKMMVEPSKVLDKEKFALRIRNIDFDLGKVEKLPYLSFCKLREYVSRSKINLCINRDAHRTVYASASCRPFELASFAACTVSNPYLGMEEWFEPGKEIIIVNDEKEIMERYEWLLKNDSEREKIGLKAREKVIKYHTHRHRAKEFIEIMQLK